MPASALLRAAIASVVSSWAASAFARRETAAFASVRARWTFVITRRSCFWMRCRNVAWSTRSAKSCALRTTLSRSGSGAL